VALGKMVCRAEQDGEFAAIADSVWQADRPRRQRWWLSMCEKVTRLCVSQGLNKDAVIAERRLVHRPIVSRSPGARHGTAEIPKPLVGVKGIAARFFGRAAAGSFATVRAHPGWLSLLSLIHSKSGVYGAFVWRTAGHLTA
jgi:hypothetical protein